MNKKGFTLVELIATVLILCLIALVAIVSINKVVKDAQKNGHFAQADNVLTAAITYVSTNNNISMDDINNGYTITLKELADNGFIDKDIVDTNNKKIDLVNSYVKVTVESDTSRTDDTNSLYYVGNMDYRYNGNQLYVLTIVYE